MDKKYYKHLRGGIMEAFGRLFIENLKVYIYPGKEESTDQIITSENMPMTEDVKHLYRYLTENQYILDITGHKEEVLPYFSHLVLQKIKNNDAGWENMVPRYVSAFIKSKKLFGYTP